jgi:hypothetical protein
LPPILINIIENLENIELSQIIQLCIDTYEKYDTLPACLIIAIQQLNENIIEKSSSCQELSFLREISSTFWAKQFLLTSSKERINRNLLKHYHPLLDIVIAITWNKKRHIV